MRKCRVPRLVLAATVIGAVGILALPWNTGETDPGTDSTISEVDWILVDEPNPWPSGEPAPSPSYDGDGTADPTGSEGEDGNGGDGPGPEGDGASPESGPKGEKDDNESGGIIGMAFPAQAGASVGLLALAFLALLPGRKMPERLR